MKTLAEVEAPLVIGYDFLAQYGCLLDFKNMLIPNTCLAIPLYHLKMENLILTKLLKNPNPCSFAAS